MRKRKEAIMNNYGMITKPRRVKHETIPSPKVEINQTIIEYRTIIPDIPRGLIGEKVVYSPRYLKKIKHHDSLAPVPDCGYFIITKAVLCDDGRVMVALHPMPYGRIQHNDGTDICLGNMVKYNENDLINF